MKDFFGKWGKFISVILGPGSAIFTVLAVISLAVSFTQKENIAFANLLAILSAISGGIAGSFIRDDFNKLTGENILEKKGRSAIRNLQSIGKQVSHICEWIGEFSKEKISRDQKRTLEEIDRHLSTARMNIEAGFEDWVDVVPELASAAEVTKRQEEVLQAYVEELFKNKKELIESGDEKKTAEIKEHIAELEKQIKRLENTPVRWVGPRPVISAGMPLPLRKCGHCGHLYRHGKRGPQDPTCPRCYPLQDPPKT